MPFLPRTVVSGLLLLAGVTAAQAQQSALTLTDLGPTFESAPYTLGFAFSVNTDVRLVALGVYDHGADGLEAEAQVGLWQGAGLDAIATGLVPVGTAAALDGAFRFVPVTPKVLKAGEVYLIGAYLDGGVATSIGMASTGAATLDPRVSLLGDRFGDGFFTITYPGQSDGTPGAWLGANFQLTPVPEPATVTLLAWGLLAMGWRRRASAAGRAH